MTAAALSRALAVAHAEIERLNAEIVWLKSQSSAGYARGEIKQAAIRPWTVIAGEMGGMDA